MHICTLERGEGLICTFWGVRDLTPNYPNNWTVQKTQCIYDSRGGEGFEQKQKQKLLIKSYERCCEKGIIKKEKTVFLSSIIKQILHLPFYYSIVIIGLHFYCSFFRMGQKNIGTCHEYIKIIPLQIASNAKNDLRCKRIFTI